MWESVFQGFSELSKSEQFKLYNAINFLLFPANQGDVAKIIKDIRESRFYEGLAYIVVVSQLKRTENIEEGNGTSVKIAEKRSMIRLTLPYRAPIIQVNGWNTLR